MREAYVGDFRGWIDERVDGNRLQSLLENIDPTVLGDDSRFTIVKRKRDKGTFLYRLSADFGPGPAEYYFKLFREADVWSWTLDKLLSVEGRYRPWRYLGKFVDLFLARSATLSQYEIAEHLGKHKVPTAPTLAALYRGRGLFREEVIITEAVPGLFHKSVKQYLRHGQPERLDKEAVILKHRLVEGTGRFVRQVCNSGIYFPDLHLQNLLFAEAGAGFRFWLVDISEGSFEKIPDQEVVILDRLNRKLSVQPHIGKLDRVRFLKAYLGDDGRDLGRMWNKMNARKDDTEVNDASTLAIGNWRGRIIKEYADTELVKLFEADDFPASTFGGHIETIRTHLATLYKLSLNVNGQERVFYAKSFEKPAPRDALKSVFEPTDAARSWKASRIMTGIGMATPGPVALFEQKVMGLRTKSVFINEAIPHTLDASLDKYFRGNFDMQPLPLELLREKRQLIRLLGEMYYKAHAQDGLYFPDFHPHNMLLRKSGSGKIEIFMVDFDEVRFKVRKKDRLKNLTSLGRNVSKLEKKMTHQVLTTGDRLRFIKAYLGPAKDTRENREALCKDIMQNWNMK